MLGYHTIRVGGLVGTGLVALHTATVAGPPLVPRLPSIARHANPRAAEKRQMTMITQIGPMKLELQVSVEIDVLISRTSTHQPRRYPRMTLLGSEVSSPVREVLGVEEKVGWMSG